MRHKPGTPQYACASGRRCGAQLGHLDTPRGSRIARGTRRGVAGPSLLEPGALSWLAWRGPADEVCRSVSCSSLCVWRGAPGATEPGLSPAVDRESAPLGPWSVPPCRGAQELSAIEQGCAGPPDATDGAALHGADCLQDSGLHPPTIARVPPRLASIHPVKKCGWAHEPACGACASSGFWLRYKARPQELAGPESWPGGPANEKEPPAWYLLHLPYARRPSC